MTRGRLGLAGLVAIGVLFALPLPSLAQGEGPNLSGASNCTAADFVDYVDFTNGPGNTYTVVINERNISAHNCLFDGPVYGPSLAPDRVEGQQPVNLCYDCENRSLPIAQRRFEPPITVKPGEVARQTLRWNTKPQDANVKCLQLDWVGEPILLVVPSLLKPICSEVDFSRFTRVSSAEAAAMPDVVQAPGLKLTSEKAEYYAGENFSLHVTRPHEAVSNAGTCPRLYLWHRSPDGSTRLDEVRPLAFQGCKENAFGHEPGNWESGFEVDSGANSRWAGAGEHAMQMLVLTGSVDDAQLHFERSNVLRFKITDPATIARSWGRHEKGTAADITLDKDTYRVGEDIPLHVAVENFDAKVPLYAWDPVWDPCMALGIEVQDAAGHPLPAEERLPNVPFCSGHGFGPRPVGKGKVIPIERSLGAEGWLPRRPGTYTVVVSWATCSGPGPGNDASSSPPAAKLKAYAVARATATINVVDK